jgi:8-oxo-dGTP diphosphatase
MNEQEIHAAGAVLWRPGPSGTEILLVHRPRYDDWSLPKGKQEPGEHIAVTAVREVEEEASVRPVLGPHLRDVTYHAQGHPKRVDYWVARADAAKADHEVDAVTWLPVDLALDRLTYPHDRDVVGVLVPRETVPLILLRHAHAVPKGGEDLARPLNERGQEDAAVLAGLLACFAPHARVLSSPAVRCEQTVAPYAAAAGVAVEIDHRLSARTNAGDTPAALIRELMEAARPAIVCLHRENVPVALEVACAALGTFPPADSLLVKGGFWVVHAVGGELAALERYLAVGTARAPGPVGCHEGFRWRWRGMSAGGVRVENGFDQEELMTMWTSDELGRMAGADELHIESERGNGTLGSPRKIWVVRLDDDLYVRSVNGPDSAWYRGTQLRRCGHVQAGGVGKDVMFADPDAGLDDGLDAAYRTKYSGYAASIVDTILSPLARSATIRLVPR